MEEAMLLFLGQELQQRNLYSITVLRIEFIHCYHVF